MVLAFIGGHILLVLKMASNTEASSGAPIFLCI